MSNIRTLTLKGFIEIKTKALCQSISMAGDVGDAVAEEVVAAVGVVVLAAVGQSGRLPSVVAELACEVGTRSGIAGG